MATNNFELIINYAKKALDTYLAEASKTAILETGEKFIKFDLTNAKKVRIGNLVTDGMSDYTRAGHGGMNGAGTGFDGAGHNDGYNVGGARLVFDEYSLAYDRGVSFRIDEMDNEESAGIIIGNILDVFVSQKVVPEIDEVRFARIANSAYTSLGNKISETINTTKGDAHEITHSWNTAFKYLKEHGVPEEDQVIFVSPDVEEKIANTPEIYKTLTQGDYMSQKGVTFNMSAYKGRPIIVVPSDRFYDKVVTGANGYAPATGAKVINYIVCSKKAVVPVVKLTNVRIFDPKVVQDYDGYKVNFHIYHDCIIPKNKAVANYVSISATDATTMSGKVDIAMREGTASKSFTVDNYFTNPVGINGTLVMSQSAFTLGASVTIDGSTITEVIVNNGTEYNNVVGSSVTKAYFAVVDDYGKVRAISGQLTLPLKA